MNQAIRALEKETVKTHGPLADRFLDDIANIAGSSEGISSNRNVSLLFVSLLQSFCFQNVILIGSYFTGSVVKKFFYFCLCFM